MKVRASGTVLSRFGEISAWQVPLLPLGPAVPVSSFTQDELVVFVVEEWTLSAVSAFAL